MKRSYIFMFLLMNILFFSFSITAAFCTPQSETVPSKEGGKAGQPDNKAAGGDFGLNMETVFDDAIHEEFQTGVWGNPSFSLDSDNNPKSGNVCVKVSGAAWEAFEFLRMAPGWEEIYIMDPGCYSYISFWFNTGRETADTQSIVVSLDLGEPAFIADYIEGEINPDTWYRIRIPLNMMNPENSEFFRLVFWNYSDSNFDFFLDDITLEWSDTAAADNSSQAVSENAFAVDLSFTIDGTKKPSPISPFIYGANNHEGIGFGEIPHTYGRAGGNRWTAYNWETNASNAGSDWYYWNDGYISDSDEAAKPLIDTIRQLFSHNASALITVPIAGYVSADKNQTNVFDTPNHLQVRFFENRAFKNAPLSLNPDKSDDIVYQDEFVNFIRHNFPEAGKTPARQIFFDLDNEPGLWSSTHEEIHPDPVSYDELTDKNIEYGRAVKSIMPDAKVFGFVAYGFNAYIDLQGAPDSETYGDFINYYLSRMAQAEKKYGFRIVDVLDLHWYSEARGNGQRVSSENNTQAVAEARMQAPRSLWDPGYTEDSWITRYYYNSPIRLIPRIKEKIDSNYPGTGLAFSEYYYGGGDHISGGIAQADFLGIIGREGVFAASLWPGYDSEQTYIKAAFRMYLDYDGSGSSFGDLSIRAATEDNELSSVYASLDSVNPDRMVIIAINKSSAIINGKFSLKICGENFKNAEIYQLNQSSAEIQTLGPESINGNSFSCGLCPYSVTVFELFR